MINLSQDIQSLSAFKRNTNEIIEDIKTTGSPLVLTVNGRSEVVVQDAAAYRKLLDKIKHLETLAHSQTDSDHEPSKLPDLDNADIEFALSN